MTLHIATLQWLLICSRFANMHWVLTQLQKNQRTHLVAKEFGKQQSNMEYQTWRSSPEMGSRPFWRPQEPLPFPSFLSSASRCQQGVPKVCTPGIHYPSSSCRPCWLTPSAKDHVESSCPLSLLLVPQEVYDPQSFIHHLQHFKHRQFCKSSFKGNTLPLKPFHCDICNRPSAKLPICPPLSKCIWAESSIPYCCF